MAAFWERVMAGYGIAIPVGAIAILIVDMGLRRGFGLGLRIASAQVLFALGSYGLWRVWRGANQATIKSATSNGHLRTFGQFLGLTYSIP